MCLFPIGATRCSKCRRAGPRRGSSAAAGTIRAGWRGIARATFLWPIAGRAGCWKLRILAVRRGAQQHVETVARAADQDILAVDVKQTMSLGVDLGSHLANPEADVAGIRRPAIDVKP